MTTGDVIRCGYRVQHLYKWDDNASLSHNKTALVYRQQAGEVSATVKVSAVRAYIITYRPRYKPVHALFRAFIIDYTTCAFNFFYMPHAFHLRPLIALRCLLLMLVSTPLLASGCTLGGHWRRRPSRPGARWTNQLRNDTGSVPANLWRQTGHPTGPRWIDATARAGYEMTTTTYLGYIS